MKATAPLAIALSMAIAAPAMAGGAAEPAPAPVTIVPAAPAGTDWTGFSTGLQLGYGDVDTTGAAVLTGDGPLLGLRLNYDYDFGSFVVGAGLQYDVANIDIGGVTDLDSVARVGLRAGVDLTGSWIYAAGGWARATTSNVAVGDSDGYYAGIGYEFEVAPSITVGAELLYHSFDEFDLVGLEAEATTAALSVNFRF